MDAAALYRTRAREQADVFEALQRADGPGRSTRPEQFDALMVDAATPIADVLAGLVDFARPALRHSEKPDELWAWVARVDAWHVVFYGSSPSSRVWIEGEHLVQRFGSLAEYVHVEHEKADPRFDRVVFADDALRCMSREHSDFERPPVVTAKRIDQNDPWRLLEERTGVGLSALRSAIATAKPVYLICRHSIVLAGAEPNEIAVRRPVVPRAPPPSPDAVFEQAEREWISEFECRIYGHAQAVALGGPQMVPRLLQLLRMKSPRPRSSRVALAALGMLRSTEAAPELVAWTARKSEVLRATAIGALAMLEEQARPALEDGCRSRKASEKSACRGLLRVLDDPRFAPLRALRTARANASAQSITRLASEDLFAILATDLDSAPRVAEREALVREGGAGLGAHVFALRLAHIGPTPNGMLLSYEQLLRLVQGDPLAPWLLPLVLLELPFGDSHAHNQASRGPLIAAARALFGDAFGAALSLVQRVG